jgi:hypothetical protein
MRQIVIIMLTLTLYASNAFADNPPLKTVDWTSTNVVIDGIKSKFPFCVLASASSIMDQLSNIDKLDPTEISMDFFGVTIQPLGIFSNSLISDLFAVWRFLLIALCIGSLARFVMQNIL